MSTLILWHNRFSENENEAMEVHIPGHRDSKTKKRDIEISRSKNRDIEKQRKINRDILIPRHFIRGQKATTSRFQG